MPGFLGSFHTTMNLKSGALTFGSTEANLATMALAQLGRRLGVPVRSGGGQITSSNAADGQAMQDGTSAMSKAASSVAATSSGTPDGVITMT